MDVAEPAVLRMDVVVFSVAALVASTVSLMADVTNWEVLPIRPGRP